MIEKEIKDSLLRLQEVSDVVVSESKHYNTFEVLMILKPNKPITAVWLEVIKNNYKFYYYEIQPGNNNQLIITLYINGRNN